MPAPRKRTDFAAILGWVIASARQARQPPLSQMALAAAVGLTQSAWSRIERGENALNMTQLRKAARELGMSAVRLLDEAERTAADLRRAGVEVLEERPAKPARGRGGKAALALAAGAALTGLVIGALRKRS